MNPINFFYIQNDQDIDQDIVNANEAKLGNVKSKQLTASNSVINKIEDRFFKWGGATGSIYSRYSATDFMESIVNLTNCTVLTETEAGHLTAINGTVFNGPVVVKGNIFLENCIFRHSLRIINIGKNTKIELKNSTFKQIMIDPPTLSDDEEENNFKRFCQALTREKISYYVTGNNNLNFPCNAKFLNGKYVEDDMPMEKIEKLERECSGTPRENVLELTSCCFEKVIFNKETGILKLSGNCNVGNVINGKFEYVANIKVNQANKSVNELWRDLKEKTAALTYDYIPYLELNHKYTDIRCVSDTAVKLDNYPEYLHANKMTDLNSCIKQITAAQCPVTFLTREFFEKVAGEGAWVIDLTQEQDYFYDCLSPYRQPTNSADDFHYKRGMLNGSNLEIDRFHFKDWKDFEAVSVGALSFLVNKVETCAQSHVWIHCRAGVGRTGTLIAAFLLSQGIKTGTITKDNFDEELVKIVLDVRKNRSPMMVQAFEQFELLYVYGKSLL